MNARGDATDSYANTLMTSLRYRPARAFVTLAAMTFASMALAQAPAAAPQANAPATTTTAPETAAPRGACNECGVVKSIAAIENKARPMGKSARAYAGNKVEAKHTVKQYWSVVVTMDDGTVFTIGAGWILPPAYPNFSSTWVEFIGSQGAVMVDDTHRDVYITSLQKGIQFPLSSMPGEPRLAERPMTPSQKSRIATEPVCQPLAISPPNAVCLDASSST